MKRTIPFDLFGEKQELCFTNAGIAELEKAMKKMVAQIIHENYIGMDFCLTALPICLERLNQHLYEQKIDDYIFGAEGRYVTDIGGRIAHALIAAGVIGKKASDGVMAAYYPELYKEPEEEPVKNAPRTAKK